MPQPKFKVLVLPKKSAESVKDTPRIEADADTYLHITPTTTENNVQLVSLPVIRQEAGFKRTTCGCELCSCYCKIMPGYLVPSDLERLIPKDQDPMAWARTHLRASKGTVMVNMLTGETISIPSLVPAKQTNGHCRWLTQDGKCSVHANSPFGCAYFDQHMKDDEAERRNHYARQRELQRVRSRMERRNRQADKRERRKIKKRQRNNRRSGK